MVRIICIGNRYEERDSAGPQVYDQLAELELPDGVLAVDGGLSGLNLLGLVQKCRRVVFVDTVSGFAKPGDVVLIKDVAALIDRPDHLDHGAGLGYLLSMIDQVIEGAAPEIVVIGLEPPCTETAVWRAVEMSVMAASREAKPPSPAWDMGKGRKDLIA
jgi:hydrogenase maturation protease